MTRWFGGIHRSSESAIVLLILLLALFLRLFRLGFNSLWLDESFSVAAAQSPIWQIVSSPWLDSQPPFYNVLLHFWLAVGGSEFILRFLSVFWGVLSVAILYRFAKRLFGSSVALFSAFLLAIAPFHIWYSQEVRSYALGTLFGLMSMYFFFKVLSKGGKFCWLAYILVTVAGLYANYSMVFLVAAENVYFLVVAVRSKNVGLAQKWIIGQAFIWIGFSPWLPYISDSLQFAVIGYPTWITAQQIIERLGLNLAGSELVAGMLALVLLVLSITLTIRYDPRPRLRLLWAGRLVPISLVLGVYAVVTFIFAIPQGASVKRQLLIFFPVFLLAISFSVRRLQISSANLTIAAFLLTIPALSSYYLLNQKEQWREVAQLVEARGRDDDTVLLHAAYTIYPFRHYYAGTIPYKTVPLQGLSTELKQSVASYKRVWLILSNDKYVDPQGDVKRWFDSCYKAELSSDFTGVKVRLFEVGGKECP